jgi:hypothetical protein
VIVAQRTLGFAAQRGNHLWKRGLEALHVLLERKLG